MTTATMKRPSRWTEVRRLKPEARVNPVLMPSTPSIGAEQMVVIAHRFAVIDEGCGREIFVIVRKPILDGAAEQRLVARGGDLVVVRQAGCIDIGRAAHAQGTGFLRHQLGEVCLVAAEIFGDDDGGVVGRLRDDAFDRVFDRDGLAGLEVELGRILLGGVFGDLELACRA